MCFGPFLGTGLFFLFVASGLAKLISVLLLFLFLVFFYKIIGIKVTIDERGVLYKSVLQEKFLPWEEIKDVLLVVRERRSIPDYYRLEEWIQSGRSGKSYFILFRTTNEFPANPMFMFSAPIGEGYISVQYRKAIQQKIQQYFECS